MKNQLSLILILLALFCTNLEARPASNIEFELTQPDGTAFIAVQRGDEHAHWIEPSLIPMTVFRP